MHAQHLALTLALTLASAAMTTSASAQGRTRAEVRQELIEAQNSGSRLVTNASYPDVSPLFQQQAANQRRMHSGSGPEMSGSSAASNRTAMTPGDGHAEAECVGPAGFCTPYFGS